MGSNRSVQQQIHLNPPFINRKRNIFCQMGLVMLRNVHAIVAQSCPEHANTTGHIHEELRPALRIAIVLLRFVE